MSDQGTDTFVGVVAVLAVIGAVASAAGGGTGTPSNNPTPTVTVSPTPTVAATTRATASSNIPGGPMLACPGMVIADRTTTNATAGDVNLKVYYSPANGGQNCAVATRSGWSGPRGQLVITLRFADYDGRRWPRLATHRSTTYAMRSGAVYLNDTDDRCVSARARFEPTSAGPSVTVSTGRVGCD